MSRGNIEATPPDIDLFCPRCHADPCVCKQAEDAGIAPTKYVPPDEHDIIGVDAW